jgi:hypothetical protein
MKLVAITLLAVALVLVATDAGAQTAALSLSIPPSARANAMGEAFVAVAPDASASWWNPAGLGFLKRKDVSLTHAQLVPDLADDVYHEFLAFALPVQGIGTFAGSLVYLSYGESEATGPSGEPLGTFRSYEFAPTLSYGVLLAGQVGVGVSFKYIRVQLAPDLPTLPPGSGTGSTVAMDLGVLWRVPVWENRISVGGALQNLGPNITFVEDDRSDPIYRNLKVGVAGAVYDRNSFSVLLVGDVNQLLVQGEIRDPVTGETSSRYGKPIWNGGGEAAYTTKDVAVALRGGYIQDDDGSISDPTFGLGVGYKGFRVDFASVPQAEDKESGTKLDRVKKFTLGASF